MTLKNLALWLLIVTTCTVFSLHIAASIEGTDFPVYYTAAKLIINGNSIDSIYVNTMTGLDVFPERYPQNCYFIYSPFIAYLLSPFAYISYYDAKVVFILVNIAAFFAANIIYLKMLHLWSWSSFVYSIIFMWMPLLTNFAVAQVNSLILLLIVASVYLCTRNKLIFAGVLLGLAALFKVFPLIVAALLSKTRYKLVMACFAFFALTLLFPGSSQWLEAIPTVSAGHTPIYLQLKDHNIVFFLIFSFSILTISLLAIHHAKIDDPLLLVAYALPATFTAMPVVQYHHLTLLTLTYVFFLLSDFYTNNKTILYLTLSCTIIHINIFPFIKALPSPYWSVFLVWIILSLFLTTPFHQTSRLNTAC